MLLIGIFEFGRVLFYWSTASEAVRRAAVHVRRECGRRREAGERAAAAAVERTCR